MCDGIADLFVKPMLADKSVKMQLTDKTALQRMTFGELIGYVRGQKIMYRNHSDSITTGSTSDLDLDEQDESGSG